jgi:hypothetical protein
MSFLLCHVLNVLFVFPKVRHLTAKISEYFSRASIVVQLCSLFLTLTMFSVLLAGVATEEVPHRREYPPAATRTPQLQRL